MQITPQKTDPGPVDETVNYTLKATNDCGGAETKTVALHIVGSIEQPEVKLSMRSIYFPTDRPRSTKSQAALLPSEMDTLKSIAETFAKYLAVKPDAHLVLSGHADRRGPEAYNKPLSERRAELVKRYLIEQGIPEANIETKAFGKEDNLTDEQVKGEVDSNADLTPGEKARVLSHMVTIRMASNRRVDVTLSTTGQTSVRQFPFNATDALTLIGGRESEMKKPGAKKPVTKKKPQ